MSVFRQKPRRPPDWTLSNMSFTSSTNQTRKGVDDASLTSFVSNIDPVALHWLDKLSFHSLHQVATATSIPSTTDIHHLCASLDSASRRLERYYLQSRPALKSICAFFGWTTPNGLFYDAFSTSGNTISAFSTTADSASMPIVIDTGASRSLSPHRSDFVSFTPLDASIQGVGATSKIKGSGRVRWKIIDMRGVVHEIETMAYYVPNATIRLYSPQYHFKENMVGSMKLNHNAVSLHLSQQKTLEFPFNPSSNLPLMLLADHLSFLTAFFAPSGLQSSLTSHESAVRDSPLFESMDALIKENDLSALLVDESNSNLSKAQKELLVWHWKLGHVDMKRLQSLMHPS